MSKSFGGQTPPAIDERKMNRKAYLKLALSCDDAVSHQLIKKSTSVDFPQGSAKKAWEALADRWEPKKEVNKQTLTNELFTLKLDDVSKDPEKWILLLQEKQTKLQVMGETISDGLLMSHILGNLPKEYEHVADNLARDSNKTITSVTDELKEKFERMKIAGTVDESEKALTGYKKFSGNCNYCGKQGHKSFQCFKKEQAERNGNKKSDKGKTKFQGECHHCGKKGHKKADCFKLKEAKADESGAVVLMAEDIAEEMDEEFSGWTNDPNEEQLMCQLIHEPDVEEFHEISLIQDRPIFIMDNDERLDAYLDSRKSDSKLNWWADCCKSDQSSEFSEDDDEDDLPDLISRNDDSDDDDDDDLTVLTNDEVNDDDDLVLIIPNDDDSTGEPIVIGREIAYTDEEMNEWCTVPETEEQEVDEVCLTTGLKNRIDDNLMIGDSGATVHMRRDTSGMYDLREEKCIIKYGNGAQSTSTIVGKWAGMIKDNGVLKKVILDGVTVVPGSAYNLFSLTRALNKGIVKSNGETMILECNGTTIRFDHRIETANGFLLAARFEPMELQNESAHVGLKEGTNVQIMKFHTMMGHANEDSIRLTAKHMGVILTGKMMKCEPCAIGKLKQMSVPKVASREVTKPGEVLYMDTASIDKPSMGSKKFWFLFVDGFSDHTISCFGKHKSDLMRVGIDMLLDLKKKDIVVKTIRCDNAGENKMLEQACRKQGLQIVFEYTAPGTPQQNGVVERKFATLFGKVRSMNNGAGLHDTIRQQLWAEAANCATDLECLLVKKTGNRTPYELFYGKVAPYGPYLRTFGEIGVARNIATVKGKLDDRGSPAIFLGYAKQHAGNVYRMLDLKTQQLRLSRDVQWLSKTYGEYKNPQIREDAQDDDHDSQLGIGEDDHDVQDNSEVENQDEENTQDDGWQEVRAGRERLIYQPKPTGQTRSGSSYKAAAMIAKGIPTTNSFQALDDTVMEDISKEEEFADIQEYVLYAEGKFDEPKTFQEAWNHPDPEERKKWREAIRKEFHDMIVRKVWRKTSKSSIPSHRRLIGCKWIFKKKKDGRYRARLCALGYSQIPGEDFMDTSSPVVDDVTVRIIIACMMINGWENEVVDITTAFLHGDMEEEVYMKCPDGIDLIEEGWNLEDDCVELLQTIYGTKQAARQYWKKFMNFLEKKGFERTHAEPCLLKRIDNNGTVVICVYVDDCLLTGDRKAIDAAMADIESGFETRRLGPLEEYIGCSVIEQQDGSKKLIQPDMIKKIEKEFGDAVSYVKNTKVPMASGITVIRPTEDDPLLSPEDQKDYRSAVGMLLYLVKHSRPDLSNSVRELSKVMDGATDEHVRILHRVIKFVIDTKDRGVLIKPVKKQGVFAYCDSDFAGDLGNRRSITGFLIYLFGVPISWKSKQQGGVTLSSSEAEYYAISEVSMELKFVKMVMDFLDIEPGGTMKVFVDNLGAIHLANNASSGSRTKHIDTRLHFVRELTQGEDKLIDIEFVRSEENQSDTFTKNTSNDTFWRLTSKYMVGD